MSANDFDLRKQDPSFIKGFIAALKWVDSIPAPATIGDIESANGWVMLTLNCDHPDTADNMTWIIDKHGHVQFDSAGVER